MTQSEEPSEPLPELDSAQLSEAERIFCEFVRSTERLDSGAFEELCAARPELEAELRQIHFNWTRVSGLLEHLQGGPTFGERLRRRYGSEIDPAISLDHRSSSGSPESAFSGDSASGRLAAKIAGSPTTRRYDINDEVARGGMGAIYKIWDKDLRRTLAMKVMLRDAATDGGVVDERVLGRFLEEAQITGQLDHPGIVPVHDLGLDARGRVYFTMRYVRGIELKQVLDHAHKGEEGWTRFRVLEVLLRICEACAFAHSKGVVHRDLKPANVMVGRFGETYVMDWGLAKVLGSGSEETRIRSTKDISLSIVRTDRGEESPDSPLITLDGDVVGTPSYMSPEQALGKLDEVGPRSDIYAVGCVLYQLLTGQVPYVQEGVRVSPHTVLSRLLEGPPTPVAKLVQRAPAELTAICEKAMERDAADRYASMMDLAEDLRAFLEGRVVQAYDTGAVAEFRAWVTRNKGLAAASAAAVVIAILGLTSVLFTQVRARDDALAANARLESTNAELEDAKASVEAFAESEREAAEEARIQAHLAQANEELARRRSYVNQLTTVDYSLRVNEFGEAVELLEECEERYRGWEWENLSLRADTSLLSIDLSPRRAAHARFSADGKQVLVGKGDSFFDYRDVESGELVERLVPASPIGPPGATLEVGSRTVFWSALSSDARFAAAWAREATSPGFGPQTAAPSVLVFWDLQAGPEGSPPTRQHLLSELVLTDLDPDLSGNVRRLSEFWITAMAVAPGSGLVALAVEDRVYFVDPEAWEIRGHVAELTADVTHFAVERGERMPIHVRALEFSADGSRLAIALEDDTLRVADTASGEIRLTLPGHDDTIVALALHPSLPQLASASRDDTVRLWDLETGALLTTLVGHDDDVVAVAFDPSDANRVASGSHDSTARVWDLSGDAEPAILRGHHGVVTSISFASDGSSLVTASDTDNTVRVWDPLVTEPFTEMDLPTSREIFRAESTTAAVLAPEGTDLYSGTSGGAIWRWEPNSGSPIARLEGPTHYISALAVSPDGRLLASAAGDDIWLWSTETNGHLGTLTGHDRRITDLGFLPDGRLASSALDDTVAVWDAQGGTRLLTYTGHGQDVRGLAIDPKGRYIASHTSRNELHLWNPDTGELARSIDIEGRRVNTRVTALAFHPSGMYLGAGLRGNELLVCDVETGEEALRRPSEGEISRLTYHPDGTRIVSGDKSGNVTVWGSEWGERLLTFQPYTWTVGSLQFDPRGKRLLTTSPSNVANSAPRLWETAPPVARRAALRKARTIRDRVVPLVDQLFDELHFVADVKRRLARQADLSSDERVAALRFATLRGDDAQVLRTRALLLLRPSEAYGAADTRTAVRLAERAAELEPESASAIETLGICLYHDGDYAAAIAQFDREEALSDARASDRADELALGRAYRSIAQHRIERGEQGPDPSFLLATSRSLLTGEKDLVAEELYALAEDLAREVSALEPDNPSHRVHLGLILYRSGAFEESLATLEQAASELRASGRQPDQLHLATSFELLCNYRLGRVERGDDVASLLRQGVERDLALTDKVRSTYADLRSALSNSIQLPFTSDDENDSTDPEPNSDPAAGAQTGGGEEGGGPTESPPLGSGTGANGEQ